MPTPRNWASTWKIHPVISIEHLEPVPNPDPFQREAPAPEATTDKRFPDDTDRYEVKRVLDSTVRCADRYRTPRTDYLIQWRGQRREEAEWVKERDAIGAEEAIDEFKRQRQQ
ncbi:hypothetical protein N7449_008037 [Penicillium cf. viridicatum]|uniref:Chromo domain-containing protein n=1 Tax=Penicillium cf. viridicatum TaxID=2972119 RepID=A0A9W9MD54_9EURO|nr:hypothetical protein N7449_008037 [Penicillium cf. viridicatum]